LPAILRGEISANRTAGSLVRYFLSKQRHPHQVRGSNFRPNRRLFLPFDAAIGREMKNNWVISLEAAVPIIKDYPVYNFKAGLRIVRRF
jgi:hypothetical protein